MYKSNFALLSQYPLVVRELDNVNLAADQVLRLQPWKRASEFRVNHRKYIGLVTDLWVVLDQVLFFPLSQQALIDRDRVFDQGIVNLCIFLILLELRLVPGQKIFNALLPLRLKLF